MKCNPVLKKAKWFKNKRLKIAEALPRQSALLLESLPVYFRQPDVPYPYRQDSYFYYLTGWQEPESLFLLTKELSVLFIQPKDLKKEAWEGYRYTAIEAKRNHLVDKVHTIDMWEEKLSFYLKGVKVLYLNSFTESFKQKILKNLNKRNVKPASSLLGPFRQIKDSEEIGHIKKAISITGKAHKAVASALKPGISEQTLHGIFIKTLMENGSQREGYSGIVASGNNATVLHYQKNNSACRKGELLLLDAGGESHYYTADITRVYPVSGTFFPPQREVYEALCRLQKTLIQSLRPKVSWSSLNRKMFCGITEILKSLRIIKPSHSASLVEKICKRYLPHSLGHHLGLDVHDPPFPKAPHDLLKPGMVVTVEPGLYFPKNCPIPGLRGTGFRIEDNILVTKKGQENLSRHIPK